MNRFQVLLSECSQLSLYLEHGVILLLDCRLEDLDPGEYLRSGLGLLGRTSFPKVDRR